MTEKLRIVRATRSRLTIGHNKDMFANRCRKNRKAARDVEVWLTLREAAWCHVRRAGSRKCVALLSGREHRCASAGHATAALKTRSIRSTKQVRACTILSGALRARGSKYPVKRALTTVRVRPEPDYLRLEINFGATRVP